MISHPHPNPPPWLCSQHPPPKLPPPQQHRIRISQMILKPPPDWHPHPQSHPHPQFVAATSLIFVPPELFDYNVSYEGKLAHVSEILEKLNGRA